MPFSLGEFESDSYVREALEHFVESRREADSSTSGWDVDKHSTIRHARNEMDPAAKGRGWCEEFGNNSEIGGWDPSFRPPYAVLWAGKYS